MLSNSLPCQVCETWQLAMSQSPYNICIGTDTFDCIFSSPLEHTLVVAAYSAPLLAITQTAQDSTLPTTLMCSAQDRSSTTAWCWLIKQLPCTPCTSHFRTTDTHRVTANQHPAMAWSHYQERHTFTAKKSKLSSLTRTNNTSSLTSTTIGHCRQTTVKSFASLFFAVQTVATKPTKRHSLALPDQIWSLHLALHRLDFPLHRYTTGCLRR